MTNQEVLFLHQNLNVLERVRNTKIAYAVIKNAKKLLKERNAIVEDLNKMRGDVEVEEFAKSEEGLTILNEESQIALHMLTEIPGDIQFNATELMVLDMLTIDEKDKDDGKPDGPKLPPK